MISALPETQLQALRQDSDMWHALAIITACATLVTAAQVESIPRGQHLLVMDAEVVGK